MSITKAMRKGFMWVLLERSFQQVLQFGTLFIIARLIGPEQFGLFSIAQIIPTTCIMILLGMSDGVIAKKAADDEALSTIFWAVVFIGLGFALVNFQCASWIARKLGDPRLVPMVQAMSLIPVLSSLSNVPTLLVQRRMDFRFFALRSILSSLIGGAVGLGSAWYGYRAMSIVYQLIVQQVVVNLVIWPSAGWRPYLRFSLFQAYALMSPGIKLSFSYVVETLDQQLPRYLISLAFGSASAGRFTLVTRIWSLMREVFVLPISVVLFPALARIDADNRNEIGRINEQVLTLLVILVTPAIMVASFDAQYLFRTVFGDAWVEAGAIARFYLIGCVLLPSLVVVRTTCRVLGLMTAYCALQTVGLIGALAQFFLWSPYGLNAYLTAYSVWNIICGIVIAMVFYRRMGVDLLGLSRLWFRVILVSLTILLVMLLAQWQLIAFLERAGFEVFVTVNILALIGLLTLGYAAGLHIKLLRCLRPNQLDLA